jgi:amino acid adenylation domain-containing protein/non-ribosomal peptide synthase protein (TIGR01720 family)/FkbM family methyltransferase
MSIPELILDLQEQGIYLNLAGAEIEVSSTEDEIPDEAINKIRDRKTELIAFLAAAEKQHSFSGIPAAAIREYYPLTSAQNRLYVLQQLDTASTAYNMVMLIPLKAKNVHAKVLAALQEIINRHDSLRTSFEMINGHPVQRIHAAVPFSLPQVQCNKPALQQVQAEFTKPFSLEQAPLLRALYIDVADAQDYLLVDMHHIITDGVSQAILEQEFSTLYAGGELAPLALQYRDYAEWLNSPAQQQRIAAQEAYWLEKLSGELPVLELPCDYQRPLLKSAEGAETVVRLGRQEYKILQDICAQQDATLYMCLVALLNVWLSKLSGQDDIIIGSVAAARSHADLENIIGLFINTLALRNNPSGSKRFGDFLQEVKENTIAAYEHQEYYFEDLVEKLAPGRDMGRNPIFDVIFALQNQSASELVNQHEQEGKHYSTPAKFDLTITATETGDTLLLRFGYSTKLFNAATIDRFIGYFRNLIHALKADEKIAKLQLITAEEQQQLSRLFNDVKTDYPAHKNIPTLFEEQVAKTPGNTALVFTETASNKTVEFTYRQLNEVANRLAHYLRQKVQVQPDDHIGIRLHRSEWFIVSILGILKAGAAYVPIDPAYPAARIDYMVKDSNCVFTIDDEVLADFIDHQHAHSAENPGASIAPSNLAYIMYTSGSTGTPKGVMVEHRNVVNFVTSNTYISIAPTDAFLSLSNFSFDGSVFDLFCPLLNGAKTVVQSKDDLLNIALLDELIAQHGITTFFITTALFNSLVDNGAANLYRLKYLATGGEKVSLPHVTAFKARFPQVNLLHVYGPTENTTFSCAFVVDEAALNQGIIPIGKPIANIYAYVLDRDFNLCPPGIAGELCLGGDNLARGYLGNPALTAEKFIEDPFNPGKRIYRTGDLVRWLPASPAASLAPPLKLKAARGRRPKDGNIDFIGRRDNQVKIRGYRIELGEVENILARQPQVKEVLVTLWTDAKAEKNMVAYLVADEQLDFTALREQLKATIPDYLVPAWFVQLEKFPVNSNGKIDKKQLPAPDVAGASNEHIPPRNSTEERLLAIWQEVLGSAHLGVTDNFFECGGHSLKALRLSSLIHKEFEAKLVLKDLFIHPTIEAQARLMAVAKKEAYADIQPAPQKEKYQLSSAQKRVYFLQEFSPGSISYNIPMVNFLGLNVDVDRLNEVFTKLVARHESLRTSFEKEGDEVYQKLHEQVSFAIDEHACEDGGFLDFMKAYIRPFDLSQAPLVRAALVKIQSQGYVLVIDIHHIAADGSSLEILLHDFAKLYNNASLPELKLQYKDFSEWQNGMIARGAFDEQKAYWRSQFAGEIPKLNFPADRNRPAAYNFEGDGIDFFLDAGLTKEINAFAKKVNGTLQTVLLSALNVLLYKYTGQQDFVVGCGIAGRRHPGVQDIVGMFVNTLAIRNYPNDELSFEDFTKNVIASSIGAYENQDLQFEDLVDMLKVERDPSRNPLFDVCLLVQNFGRLDNETSTLLQLMGGGETTVPAGLTYKSPTTKFDLTWFVEEKGDAIRIYLEYYAAIFDASTIERIIRHFKHILTTVVKTPQVLLAEINLLEQQDEQELLANFVSGPVHDYPANTTLHELFEMRVLRTPDHIAIRQGDLSFTFRNINERANRLANFLAAKTQLQPEQRVGILLSRSAEMMISILATLKAGGAYVPLDSDYPEDRLLYTIEDAAIDVVLTESGLVEFANRLQWRSPFVKYLVCVDSNDIYSEKAGISNDLMRKDLWDHVGDTANGLIKGGGWMSSYTGEDLSELEMSEYSRNAYLKLKPYLHPGMKVLEIGCSTGLTMFQVAPEVGSYWGTDLSSSILAITGREAVEKGHTNISLACMPAHEIDTLEETGFDLVIINSVIHCFNGHNYLREVLSKAIQKMNDKALLFLGDLMDEDKRTALISDLAEFSIANRNKGYRTKTDWSAELFVSRNYLNDLIADKMGIAAAEYSEKIYTVANELTRYRYDALMRVDKSAAAMDQPKTKYQFDRRWIDQYSTASLPAIANSNNLAYVIYTSGSTGRPKGCMLEHRGVINRIEWMYTHYGFNDDDIVLQKTTFTFDVSVWEIFLPLCWGGSMVLCHKDDIASPERILGLIERHGVTCLHFVPSMLNVFCASVFSQKAALPSSLKRVVTSGEALSPELVKHWYDNTNVVIHNLYGPTEASVDVTYYETRKGDKKIPIGRPIWNTRMYILGAQDELLPLGVIGEIAIGGDGLARGYLNKPELTAEKFKPGRYYNNERIYRTGDVGRWLPDGNIEYLGRKDDQVKIRGYRIELGEIESVLNKHPMVETSVVAAWENKEREKELVAYYVPDASQGYTMRKILEHKRTGLPANAALYEYPGNLHFYAPNKTESQFLYDEIFRDQVYLKNGITIAQDACVVDVGANLGFFSVFASILSKGGKVYSFEPLPPIYEILKLNTSLYPGQFNVFNLGISKRAEKVNFSYYPHATILSGRYAEDAEVTGLIRQFIQNTEQDGLSEAEVSELLQNRLVHQQFECELKTLSQIISENNIGQIDLLKIDVEKSELDVLEGIAAEDWKKIKQVVLEIHDIEGRLQTITGMLTQHGFNIQVSQSSEMSGTAIFDVYAIAKDYVVAKPGARSVSAANDARNIREDIKKFLMMELPSYMIPAHFVQVEKLPVTPNGKVDRAALRKLDGLEVSTGVEYVAPRNRTEEQLVNIWSEILGVSRNKISVKDNFFELGGHSLKSTRLSSQVHKEFEVKISLSELFKHTRLEDQAALIANSRQAEFSPILPVPLQKDYPLSPAQRRLYIVSQFEGASVAYNIPAVYSFAGELNYGALQLSFKTLIQRHEILRTVFRENAQGEVRQLVLPASELDFDIALEDVSDKPNAVALVDALLQAELQQKFDLSAGPLLRAKLIRHVKDKYVFSCVMHHIISDGWSMEIMIKELLALYKAYNRGEHNPLKPLRIQYKDYAAWQLEQFETNAINAHKEYWLKQLQGELPVIDLPGSAPRPAIKTYNGGAIEKALDKNTSEQIKQLCQQQGCTLFMALLAGVNALLYRYTGMEDIVIGSPIAGREHVDLEDQVGFYVNTLALRSTFDGGKGFADLLAATKKVTLEAYEHQAYPFDELVSKLALKRDKGRSPLFDVVVALQNIEQLGFKANMVEVDGLLISGYKGSDAPISKFDLTFNFYELDGRLVLNLEYNTDIYNASMIGRLTNHLQELLNAAMEHPALPVAQLNYLGAQERHQLLQVFNAGKMDYPAGETVLSLFEKQARENPANAAVVDGEVSLTYQQVNEAANKLAAYLKAQHGVKPADMVAVTLRRSHWLVVSMMAVLKCGAAYMPVDTEYPADRIEYMLNDSGCKLLIDEAAIEKFKQAENIYSKENTAHAVEPVDAAYVIYTSGSTGKPKGVVVQHKALMNLCNWHVAAFDVTANDHATLYAGISFDASVWEMFPYLVSGACLYVIPEDARLDMQALTAFYERHNITISFLPTKIAERFFDVENSSLRYLLTGGDKLNHFVSKPYKVVNNYGPTENAVVATSYVVNDAGLLNIPIGKPITDTQVYILDAQHQLVPVGMPGEICLGGKSLSKGYLHREELTNEKFVNNPYEHNGRMYKTGDIGRWLPDGNIEYLGRNDDQVKLRGYRIEPGEIEAALQAYGPLDSVLVMIRKQVDEEPQLVAYFTSKEVVNISALREFLGQRLPAYMVPAHFVQLEQFPLNANGKVDKSALPDVAATPVDSAAYVAPRNAIERCLVEVYEDVLKKHPIGIKEDFFMLGGDSIKSIQLVARLKQKGYTLTIRDVLTCPVIEALSDRVKLSMRVPEQGVVTGAIPLGPIQAAFLQDSNIDKHHFNQSVLLQSKEPLDVTGLKQVFDKIVTHHDALRMVFRQTETGWVQENKGLEQTYSFEVVDVFSEDYCQQVQSSINLETGPLFKVVLFGTDRLLMVAHHLIIDGVSWRILFEDISTLYQQYLSGEALSLPQKSDSFKFWQQREQNFESSYWDEVEAAAYDELPAEGRNLVQDVATIHFTLDEAQTTSLLTKCYNAYKTGTNDVLLAALSLGLKETFGISNILIALEGHGREQLDADVDVSRTVGWFTSVYPVVLKVNDADAIKQLVSVKETLHRVPEKGIGYGVLRYSAGKDYKLNPQISFNYLGDFGAGLQTGAGTLFTFSNEPHGREASAHRQRETVLDVSGMVVAGKLNISVSYSNCQFEAHTIEQLANAYRQNLQQLIERISSTTGEQLTPVDLTYNKLKIEELQELNEKHEVEDIYPLSPLQEGMYYQWLVSPNTAIYFDQITCRIRGNMNVGVLEQSYRQLVARHGALRTCFTHQYAGRSLQIVSKNAQSEFVYRELTAQIEQEVASAKEADRSRGFDLEQGSQMRLTVLRTGTNTHELIWSHHHILMDGWCLGLLIKEFFDIYHALINNETPALAKVYPYANYVSWLGKVDHEKTVSYWKNYLAGFKKKTHLPKNNATGFTTSREHTVKLEGTLREDITKACAVYGITENTLISAAWGMLLGRYNRADDVVFGAVVSGRPADLEGVETMIGLFINTVPVRIRLEQESTIAGLLQQIQQNAIRSSHYHYTQLARIQAVTELGNELFDHILVFENYPVQEMIEQTVSNKGSNTGMVIEHSETHYHDGFDFNISVLPGQVIHIKFKYSCHLYDDAFVQKIGAEFMQLLQILLEVLLKPGAAQSAKKLADVHALVNEAQQQNRKEHLNKMKSKNLLSLKSKN